MQDESDLDSRSIFQAALEQEIRAAENDASNEEEHTYFPSAASDSIVRHSSNYYPCIFDKLPDEALIRIWSFLDPITLGRAARVNKR
jgi:hypothetical protein